MAGPGGGDEDSLPCAAPAPFPAPPVQPLVPDPDVVLTPDREGAAAATAGILRRRRGRGKIPRQQVRFRLDCGPHEVGGGHLDLPGRVEETQGASTSSHAGGLLRKEPSGSQAEDGHLEQPPGLSTPVLHSSIALGAEVQAAREQAFDARQAARDLLQRSFPARCAVEARVGESMNIPREQQLYRGLVSLQVPEEDLLSSAVRERLALAGPRPEGRREPASEGPDLMAFYDPEELFTETAFLEVEGLPSLERKPRPRDPSATFLMYRKLRQWDS